MDGYAEYDIWSRNKGLIQIAADNSSNCRLDASLGVLKNFRTSKSGRYTRRNKIAETVHMSAVAGRFRAFRMWTSPIILCLYDQAPCLIASDALRQSRYKILHKRKPQHQSMRRPMCEHHCHVEKGWKGWLDIPAPQLIPCTEPWLEISHTITEDLARIPVFPEPRIRRIRSLPQAVANLTELCMVAHHGTHVDAPIHYISDGPSMDEVPLDRLYGQGVVWRIDLGPNGVIRPEDFEAARPRMKASDIVILDTCSARHVNTDSYWDHPTVSGEAAEWLVRQGAKILAIDAPTPDLSPKNRPASYDFPAHHILLSHGVLIAEHMTKLEPFTGRRVEAMFMALNLKGSDGGPARVVARPID